MPDQIKQVYCLKFADQKHHLFVLVPGECWQDFEDFEQQKTSTVAAEANEWPDFPQEPNRGKENFDSQNGGDMWQDYQASIINIAHCLKTINPTLKICVPNYMNTLKLVEF